MLEKGRQGFSETEGIQSREGESQGKKKKGLYGKEKAYY